MLGSNRRVLTASFACAAATLLASSGRAQTSRPANPATMTLDGLETIITNMGYECKTWTNAKGFAFDSPGSYNLTINASLNTGEDGALFYVFLNSFKPDEFGKLKLSDLLLSNDSWRSYFSLEHTTENYTLYIQYNLPSGSITPAKIRSLIDNFQKHLVETESIWNKAKWQ